MSKLPSIDDLNHDLPGNAVDDDLDDDFDRRKSRKKKIVITLIICSLCVIIGVIGGVFYLIKSEMSANDLPAITVKAEAKDIVNDLTSPPLPLAELPISPAASLNSLPPSPAELNPVLHDVKNIASDSVGMPVLSGDYVDPSDMTVVQESLAELRELVKKQSDQIGAVQSTVTSQYEANLVQLRQIKMQLDNWAQKQSKLVERVAQAKSTAQTAPKVVPPPSPVAFAIWSGKDAAMVTVDGDMRFLYPSDMVGDWRVVEVTQDAITYQSVSTKQKRTLKVGD